MLKPYDDSVATWCHDRRQEILQSTKMPRDQLPLLDRIILEHEYQFGNISAWPNDCCLIQPLNSSDLEMKGHCFLGSLAACRDLSSDYAAGKIHCVVSFCGKEMRKIRGQPDVGWKAFFEQLHIHWICLDLDDPRTKLPGSDPFCEDMVKEYLSAWIEMCIALVKHLEQSPAGDGHGALFHCFAGINRSSAGLCAWMIFRCEVSGKEALESLLTARPSLNPWHHRPHVLWALRVWELDQERIFRPQIRTRAAATGTE